MTWFFKKKPAPKVPRRIEILPGHQMELRELWDAYVDNEKSDKVDQYRFWSRAETLYPAIATGTWNVRWGGLNGYFVEFLKS